MLPNYTELSHLYVSAASVKRILNIPASRRIEFVSVTPDRAVVNVPKLGEVTITRAQFEAEFIRYRKEGSKECIAQPHNAGPWGETYKVTGAKGDVYYCEAGAETIACMCEDWSSHQGICKHGYAVLNLLNLSTFEQYVRARRKVVSLEEKRLSVARRQNASVVNGYSID